MAAVRLDLRVWSWRMRLAVISAVRAALQADLVELSQRYIRKASSVLITGEERKNLWLQVAKKLIDKNLHEALEYLLANSPLKI
jgi:hypothetical protein